MTQQQHHQDKILSGEVNAKMIRAGIYSAAIQYMQAIQMEMECTSDDAKMLTAHELRSIANAFEGKTGETDKSSSP